MFNIMYRTMIFFLISLITILYSNIYAQELNLDNLQEEVNQETNSANKNNIENTQASFIKSLDFLGIKLFKNFIDYSFMYPSCFTEKGDKWYYFPQVCHPAGVNDDNLGTEATQLNGKPTINKILEGQYEMSHNYSIYIAIIVGLVLLFIILSVKAPRAVRGGGEGEGGEGGGKSSSTISLKNSLLVWLFTKIFGNWDEDEDEKKNEWAIRGGLLVYLIFLIGISSLLTYILLSNVILYFGDASGLWAIFMMGFAFLIGFALYIFYMVVINVYMILFKIAKLDSKEEGDVTGYLIGYISAGIILGILIVFLSSYIVQLLTVFI